MGEARKALLYEVSWEVANKVGGIHTVLTGKVAQALSSFEGRYVCIGPYLSHGRQYWTSQDTHSEWRTYFERKYGFAVHTGIWEVRAEKVPTWLIDFYPLVSRKDEIFRELWEEFGVDSLWSSWDYIEPAIFGYAAGMAIASFLDFYYEGDRLEVIAHFHEWLTGAGLLYLKQHKPSVATVFTTHATLVGRAAEGQSISEDPKVWASQRGLLAKYTLERAAWQKADAATTVSEVTGAEAAAYLGRTADVITPNGWEVPILSDRAEAKAFLRLLAQEWGLPEGQRVLWLLHSGRPELMNKGTIDLLEAIRRYQAAPLAGMVLGLIVAMPVDVEAPEPSLSHRLWISHRLADPQGSRLLQLLQELASQPGDGVYYAYLPVYLEGSDGVVNVPYYDLLNVMSASAFPSRYEPWGYTPQESIGLGVPTVSSLQAGYGAWMKAHVRPLPEALWLIDHAAGESAQQILGWLYRMMRVEPERWSRLRQEALTLATYTTWQRFGPFYLEAYDIALVKKRARHRYHEIPKVSEVSAEWRWGRAFFTPNLPSSLAFLNEIAYNLWWSWQASAQALFRAIDPTAWDAHENPVWLLNHTPEHRWQQLRSDKAFMDLLSQVREAYEAYLAVPLQADKPTILYLCMEYGFMRALPLYAGGLGVLAGDYLKELSDQAYPAWAVGLLYRYGYFEQEITADGRQVEKRRPVRFSDLPLKPLKLADGRWVRLEVPLGEDLVYLKVWQIEVGRLKLYLLDTDLEENSASLRGITHHLYPADREQRLLQELVLGLGAEFLARQVGLSYDLVHYNEGHPVFHFLARVETHQAQGFSLEEAIELARARTLFTTHTPVPAGHDVFPPALLQRYVRRFVEERLDWEWEAFLEKGVMASRSEEFNLTAFGVWSAARVNAVSLLHAKVSQHLLRPLYPTYLAGEVPVVGVTNGVHAPTWQAPLWGKARRLWETHLTLKKQLWAYLQGRLRGSAWSENFLEAVQRFLEEDFMDALVLGFARRVATYKRHRLLLESRRMAQLFEKYPIRLLIAGKAHPADEAGKAALQALWQRMLEPPFIGRVLFVPNYDLTLARHMVQGVDAWLNLPVYGQEASGTSGMKALFNGIPHISIPDGWWAEVEAADAGGWTIPLSPDQAPERRDPYEVLSLAALLEQEVWPAFSQRDAEGLPHLWIGRMQKARAYAAAHFGTDRMLGAYVNQLYVPLHRRALRLEADDYTGLRQRTQRAQRLQEGFECLKVRSLHLPPFREAAQPAGEPFLVEVHIEPTDIPPEERRAEIVFEKPNGTFFAFPLESLSDTCYQATLMLSDPGVYHWALRFYPYDPFMQERWYDGSLLVSEVTTDTTTPLRPLTERS